MPSKQPEDNPKTTPNDIEQRIAALSGIEKSRLLLELISALHDEDTDRCYRCLREWGLEQYLEDM